MAKEKSKTVNFSLGAPHIKRIKEIAEHRGISQSDAVRRAIDDAYSLLQREQFGYKGATLSKRKIGKEDARTTQQEAIKALSEMSDEDLTQHLVQTGYFENEPEQENMDRVEFRVVTTDGGFRKVVQRTIEAGTGTILYSRDALTWDELIRELIKEGRV